jgi:hypothetical protein
MWYSLALFFANHQHTDDGLVSTWLTPKLQHYNGLSECTQIAERKSIYRETTQRLNCGVDLASRASIEDFAGTAAALGGKGRDAAPIHI